MASESEVNEMHAVLERLISSRNRDLSLFIPFLLGFTSPDPSTTRSESDQNSGNPDLNSGNNPNPDDQNQRDRIILINPLTQGMVVIEGRGLDSLFRGAQQQKDGPPPASRSSIEAMPSVEIIEGEEGECIICLEEWESGVLVKEMPCKHRFHGGCIEKWLKLHGSCPVCRYTMPVEEEGEGKKGGGEEREREEGGERRRVQREIWVSLSFGNSSRRRREEEESTNSSDSNNDQSGSASNEGSELGN